MYSMVCVCGGGGGLIGESKGKRAHTENVTQHRADVSVQVTRWFSLFRIHCLSTREEISTHFICL